MRLLAAFTLPLVLLSGCDRPSASPTAALPAPEHAPEVSWHQDGREVSLASLRGRTLLLHFADAASPSWSALAEAYPDLNAEGATVLGVVTGAVPGGDHPFDTVASDELADAFGVTMTPAAVIIDREGWVRGRDHALDADAFFALAAPVLLDEPINAPVSTLDDDALQLDAEGLNRLVRAGAVLIDLRANDVRDAEGRIRLALPCPIDLLTEEYLPADLSATLVFLGPDAEAASEMAAEWGYVSVLELPDVAPYLDALDIPDELASPSEPSVSTARTVRG